MTDQKSKVLSFPSTNALDWKARFENIHDQGKGYLLSFPFSFIREKQVLLDLYEAVPELLKAYPDVVDKFFKDVNHAFEVAEKDIAEARLKNMPGDPAQLLLFNKKSGGNK